MLLLFITLIIHYMPWLREQMSHATFCVNSRVSLKSTGGLRSSQECLIDSKATDVPRGALFIYQENRELFQQINKSVSERLPNPVSSFISTRRPPLTKMFPSEPKLWQSQSQNCHRTTKTVNALLSLQNDYRNNP